MARINLIRTSEFPYHVTGRTNNKEWFSVSMDECWIIFEQVLTEISKKFNAEIGSFVLMSNHFHLILWTPDENLDRIMNYLMHKTSLMINKRSNKINHVFGSRYKWSLIKTKEYLAHAYRYTYQNPSRSKLTDAVENYPYSTMYRISRNQTYSFPVYDQKIIEFSEVMKPMKERLIWLNEPYQPEQVKILKKAIKRSTFSFPKHKIFKSTVLSLQFQK